MTNKAAGYLAGITGIDPVVFGTRLIQTGMDLEHTPLRRSSPRTQSGIHLVWDRR